MLAATHKWSLVGPWYREQSLGGEPSGLSPRPILQKYASSDFTEMFLDEPRRSLRFVGEDFFNNESLPPHKVINPGNPLVSNKSLKLFLDTHARFYLVVCELHCNAPGYPSVSRDQVSEAGFVIRKSSTGLSELQRRSLEPVYRERSLLQAQITHSGNRLRQLKGGHRKSDVKRRLDGALAQRQADKLCQLNAKLVENDKQLLDLKEQLGVELTSLGWKPGETKGVGGWAAVSELPEKLEGEESFPLYPLIPDPREDDHTAAGKSIWFGVIPTQSSDVDGSGAPRYDDESAYEVRCFVRRKTDCTETAEAEDCCPGELVWSEPTESYRLAPFFDLDGTGHKPINIKMPDLNSLKQAVAAGPAGRGANIRVNTPDDSNLDTSSVDGLSFPSGAASDGGSGSSICFFAIPLITIVAMFLLKLVLPIVVFLFNLWFLLSLRLCIPPSIGLDAGVAADLKVIPPEFDFDAEFSAEAEFKIGGAAVESFDEMVNVIKGNNPDGSPNPNLKDFDKGILPQQAVDEMFKQIGEGDNVHAILHSLADLGSNYGDEEIDGVRSASLPGVNDGMYYFTDPEPVP